MKDLCPEDEEKMEDSPVLGLLKEQKKVKPETKDDKGNGTKEVLSEALIKKAVRKRSSYIKANAEYAAGSFSYLSFCPLFMTMRSMFLSLLHLFTSTNSLAMILKV